MNYEIIRIIGMNEFYRVIGNPVLILISLILFILTFLNAAGGYQNLIHLQNLTGMDGFVFGYSQMWSKTNFFCGIMAAFMGVYTIAEDRFRGTSKVLFTKPLYRGDLVIGKFAGLSLFLVVFVIFNMIANFIVLSYYYGSPLSAGDFFLRIFTYTIVLSLDMMLVLALTMLIGVLFKDFLLAMAVTVTYVCYEWLWNYFATRIYEEIQIPINTYLFNALLLGGAGPYRGYNLFDTTTSFVYGLSYISQGVWFMIFMIIGLLLLTCFVYTRSDDV